MTNPPKSLRKAASGTTDSSVGGTPMWSSPGRSLRSVATSVTEPDPVPETMEKRPDSNPEDYMYNPNSKTHICRAYGTAMKRLPRLKVFEVVFYTKRGDERKPIYCRKLRTECLLELLDVDFGKNSSNPGFGKRMAINMEVNKKWLNKKSQEHEIVDQFILPFKGESDPTASFAKKGTLQSTKMELPKGKGKQEILYAYLWAGEVIIQEDGDNGKYCECFKTLVRTYASTKKDDNQGSIEWESLHDVQEVLGDEPALPLPVSARCRPIFDFDETKDTATTFKVHVDFDLVPVISKGQRLIEVLEKCFGSLVLIDVSQELSAIKTAFCGLHVRYRRPSQEVSGTQGRSARSLSTAEHRVPISPKTRKAENQDSNGTHARSTHFDGCFIRDVKPAHEMSRIFAKNGSDFKSVKEIVQTYYERDSKYYKLPFANIGKKRDYWVPLENLEIAEDQILRRCGQLVSVLRDVRDTNIPALEEFCRPIADQVYRKVGEGFKSWKSSCVASEVEKLFSTRPRKRESVPSKQKRKIASNELKEKEETLLIIYVGSPNSLHETFLQTVKARLESTKQTLIRFSRIQIIQTNSLGDLIRQSGRSGNPLMNPKFSVALGIIDNNGISKMKYREIQGELRRIGDRKLGAVTMCVEKQGLENLFKLEHTFDFPANILRKINLMLGYPVWEAGIDGNPDAIEQFDPERSIIVGAHVSHPDSVSTEGCPSVAAVVASLDQRLLVYAGSINLQANTTVQKARRRVRKAGEKQASKTGKEYRAISELDRMLEERFQAWKQQHPDWSGPGPTVFFYRGACDIQEQTPFPDERDAIFRSYEAVFGAETADEVKFTYIAVSKKVMQYQTPDDTTTNVPFTFTTTDNGEACSLSKYHYRVLHNSTSHSNRDLTKLTSKLNASAQLGPLSAKALPVTYAHKLSRRIFDYFRYASHKDITNMPVMARTTMLGRTTDKEREDKELKDGEAFKKMVLEFFADTRVRDDGKGHPWKPSLDRKMFYL